MWQIELCHQPVNLKPRYVKLFFVSPVEFELPGSTVFPFFLSVFALKINIRYNLICFKLICHHIQTCKTCLKWGTPTFYSLPVTHDLCFSGSVSQILVTGFYFVDKIGILSFKIKATRMICTIKCCLGFYWLFIQMLISSGLLIV